LRLSYKGKKTGDATTLKLNCPGSGRVGPDEEDPVESFGESAGVVENQDTGKDHGGEGKQTCEIRGCSVGGERVLTRFESLDCEASSVCRVSENG